ncbi:MAG: CPBP family glutamic-type intramembrane protease [Nanobdellota archaeon]
MEQIERNFLLVVLGIPIVEYVLNSFYTIGFAIYAIFVGLVLILMENEIGPTKEEKVIVFLMIIPICRLAELFLGLNFFWSTLLFYLMVIGLVVYYAIKFKIKTKPFIGNPGYFLIVFMIGGVGSLVGKHVFGWSFADLILLVPIIAYAEEIFFRGGFQNLTQEWFGNFSILLTSFVYAAFSLSYGFAFVLIAFFASLIISTFYHFKKNLYITYLLNIVFHVVIFLFYPIF